MKSTRYIFRLFVPAVFLCLLSACVSVNRPSVVASSGFRSFAQRKPGLMSIERWKIQGAIAIIQNKKGESANYSWDQKGQAYHIHLAGALNAGSTQIWGNLQQVTISQAGGQTVLGHNPDEFIRQNLGVRLPVSALFYWVRGLPAPAAYSHLKTDRFGRLASLKQRGWRLAWDRYISVGRVDLPRWIVLTRPGVKIKLLVRSWQFKYRTL